MLTKRNGFSFQKLQRPFVIAEISANHNGSLDSAKAHCLSAAKAGADAIKFQTYTADSLTIDSDQDDFKINDPSSLWNGRTLYELYQQAHTPFEWFEELFSFCKKHNIVCFSSPFDDKAIDLLESLNTPFYKIASFENIDLGLIARAASTNKPLIISTGLANLAEIHEAVKVARDNGCEDLVLLKCSSAYPATSRDINLSTIAHLKSAFNCQVGYSDHTLGLGVAVASVALGAMVVEKHFCLDRQEDGPDSAFSCEPEELALYCSEIQKAYDAIGCVHYGPTSTELGSMRFRRSIYAVKDIAAGTPLDKDNIRVIRPGFGLKPKYINIIQGKRANKEIKKGSPITWEHVS
jgi:pseudaminic acid synthase